MSVLAFAVSAIVLAAVGAFCWCIGFTAGVRRGNRMALRDVMRKFNLTGEEEGDNLDSLMLARSNGVPLVKEGKVDFSTLSHTQLQHTT